MQTLEEWWTKQWQQRGKLSWRWFKFFPFALWRAYSKERLPEAAQSMVYITLLTLVPLLAVAFALLRGFGISGVIEPWLADLLAPMGDAGKQVSEHLIDFVGQTRAGGLGIVGVVFLFVSVMNLAQKIEVALNRIWGVENNRNLQSRLTGYLSAVLLAPLLLGAIMSMMLSVKKAAWLQPFIDYPGIGALVALLTSALPTMLVFIMIACIYAWIPNTKVKWSAAFAGAIFFLLLWYPISWVFSVFIAGSSNYSVIYSSFATIVILLFWLFFLWLLFLMGAKVASLAQMPHSLSPQDQQTWYADEQIIIAFAMMQQIAQVFSRGEDMPTIISLSRQLHVSPLKLSFIAQRLHQAKLLAYSNDTPERLLLSKAIAQYNMRDVYRVLATPKQMLNIDTQATDIFDEELPSLLDIALANYLQADSKTH